MHRSIPAALALTAFARAASAEPSQPAPAPLTVERAVELALARDERSPIADRAADAAEARVARARSFFFPELAIGGTYTRRAPSDSAFRDETAFSATAQAQLTIFDARSIPLYRQAKLERDAARLSAAEEKRRLAFETADTFVATLGLEQVVEAARRRVELSRQSVVDARGRVEAELTSSNDLTRAELELATAERELTHARGDLAAAAEALGHLVGVDALPPLAPPTALMPAASDVAPIEIDAASRRLDLAAARKHAAALDQFADEPRMRWIPSLDLLGQYRLSTETGFSGRETDWSIAVTLSWIVWDGGERAAERRERVALARIAALEVEAGERRAATDVEIAIHALAEAHDALRQGEAVAAAARKNADETAVLYRQGLARAIEVADANARLFDAEVAVARERYGLALAVLELRAALGLDPFGKEPAR